MEVLHRPVASVTPDIPTYTVPNERKENEYRSRPQALVLHLIPLSSQYRSLKNVGLKDVPRISLAYSSALQFCFRVQSAHL